MKKIRLRMTLSFFGLMFGGLLLMRMILTVFIGIADGDAVLPRMLNVPDLLGKLFIALIVTGVWYVLTFRGKT